MNNNNSSSNFSCSFAESLVDYLYGECSVIEDLRLDKHISGCSDCSNTLAEIGIARDAVSEWKQLEFAPLATPNIEFLSEMSPKSTGILSNLEELLASLLPVPRLAAAGAGFVILLAVTGGFLVFSSKDGANETAVIDSKLDKNKVSIDQTAAPDQKPLEQLAQSEVTSIQVPLNRNNYSKDGSELPVVKNKQRSTQRFSRKTPVRNETAVTISNRPGRELPRLNDFEDYQDNSLRLSEILDEIDSGK